MERYSIAIGAVLLAAVLSVSSVAAQVVLKAGHISPKDSVEGIAIDRFADLVKQKTNGAVTVQVFPSEQLGKSRGPDRKHDHWQSGHVFRRDALSSSGSATA